MLRRHLILVVIVAVLLFVFFYPRCLLWLLDTPDSSPYIYQSWISYFYTYGLGGVCFLLGVWLILSSGACRRQRGHDWFWYRILWFGFAFMLSLQAVWILFALYYPYKGVTL